MSTKLKFFVATLAAIAIYTPPAIALTIENNLSTAPAPLAYKFPSKFTEELERIEKRDRLQFYIYAQPYDASSPLKDPRKNAGANIADEKLATLSSRPGFNYDKVVIIAWLRNKDEPTKGSIGVAPGRSLRDLGYESDRLSDAVKNAIRGHMPGDPSAALISLAQGLDSSFAFVSAMGWIVTALGLIILVAVLSFGLYFIHQKFLDHQEYLEQLNQARLKRLSKINDAIAEAERYCQNNIDPIALIFDLQLADKEIGEKEENAWNQLIYAIQQHLTEIKEAVSSKVDLSTVESKVAFLNQSISDHKAFATKIDRNYAAFIDCRSNYDKLVSLIASDIEQYSFDWLGNSYEIAVDPNSVTPKHEEIASLLIDLPISFSAWRLFQEKVEERDRFLKILANKITQTRQALLEVQEIVCRLDKLNIGLLVNPLVNVLKESDRSKYYYYKESLLKALQEAVWKKLDSQIKNAFQYNNLDALITLSQGFQQAIRLSVDVPIAQMNRIAGAYGKHLEEEQTKAAEYARKQAQAEADAKRRRSTSSYYSSDFGSTGSSYDSGSSWGSSSSSSSDYGSGSSGSSYDSGSSGGSYDSGSGGGDY